MNVETSYTINEFCEAERVSRSLLYRAWKEGWGPRFHFVGTHKRISPEARLAWRREREAAASKDDHSRNKPNTPSIEEVGA
jgi:hypothetical protein